MEKGTVKVTALQPGCRTAALAALLAMAFFQLLAAQDAPQTAPVPTSTALEELATRVEGNTTAIRLSADGASTALSATARNLEEKIDRQGAVLSRSVSDLHRTVRIAAVAGTVTGLVAAVLALLVLLRIPHIIGAIGQISSAPAPAQASGNNHPGLSAALSRIEDRIAVLSRSSPQKAPEPPAVSVPRELLDKLVGIEAAVQNLSSRGEAASSASDTTADAFWPKSVRNCENYSSWRKTLSGALASGRGEALRLAASLLAFNGLPQRREGDAERHGTFVEELSVNLYAYLYALDDVPEADRLDPVSAILRTVKDDAQAHYPGLEIRAVFPNERLNTDTMEKVDSGRRMSVARPLSWLVADKTSGKERILFRAKVTTG
jgi:hypothetical protein